jgi:hypothetical protein
MPSPPSMPPDSGPQGKGAGVPDAPGSVLRAVLTGVSIDICGSKLLGTLIFALYIQHVATPGMTDEQLLSMLRSAPPSFALVLVEIVLESLLSVVAGFACARIVQREEWRVGAMMAFAAMLVGLLLDDGGAPDDLMLLYVACDFACVMLGVKFGAERNRRIEAMARGQADAPTS